MAIPVRKIPATIAKKGALGRRDGRIDVQAAIEGEDEKTRSLASVRRQRDRERRQQELELLRSDGLKVTRDVILPDTITVSELAARMAARANDVVKSLMRMGRDGNRHAISGCRHRGAGGAGSSATAPAGCRKATLSSALRARPTSTPTWRFARPW